MNDTGAKPRVLIVEDEMHLAMMLEDVLGHAGYRVLKAARLPAALQLADRERIDAAILDINLAGMPVFPLADALRERGIPFLFASGYGAAGLPADYCGHPILQKPFTIEPLLRLLARLLEIKSTQ